VPLPATELRKKLKLERELQPRLRGLMRALAREMRRVLVTEHRLIDVNARADVPLAGILQSHYHRAADRFATQIRDELPDDAAMTPEEAAEVDARLSGLFPPHAADQARRINETSSRQMRVAVQKARRLSQEASADGETPPMSQRELATLASNLFLRRALGRVPGIAIYETQWGAETSKGVEALVLTHEIDDVVLKFRVPGLRTQAMKSWASQGDSRVRPWHLDADGQERQTAEAFSVGGENLRWPGDSTLGASAGNIMGCRCSSIFDVESIAEVRRLLFPSIGAPLTILPDTEDFPLTASPVVVGPNL
jgi:hypothetical protein